MSDLSGLSEVELGFDVGLAITRCKAQATTVRDGMVIQELARRYSERGSTLQALTDQINKESSGYRVGWGGLILAIADLQVQRDDLLEACKAALADYQNLNVAAKAANMHPFAITPSQLEAAIAKAEGGTP